MKNKEYKKNSNGDLISIIIPVYNVEKYLHQCVNSILNQTYKNIEIILVNDGSKDNSGKICDEYASKDLRVKVIHKENQGLGFARNSGLDIAKGKYVTFIDSDDYADPDLVETLYKNIINENADTCIGGFKRVDDFGNILYEEKYEYSIYEGEYVLKGIFYRMLGSSPKKSDAIRMSVWNSMYSMDIIKSNFIRFPSERVFISEDIIFDSDYYQKAKKVILIDSISYNYRVNIGSLTMKYNKERFEKCKYLCSKLSEKLIKQGFDEEAVIRLNRMFFVNVRACICQEVLSVGCPNSKKAMLNIRNICNDEYLQSVINGYPVNKMGIKQKMFIKLVQKQRYRILYFLAKMKLVK